MVIWHAEQNAEAQGRRGAELIENKLSASIIDAAIEVHSAQVLTYLRLTKHKLGLVLNFGQPLLRNGISRVVNGL